MEKTSNGKVKLEVWMRLIISLKLSNNYTDYSIYFDKGFNYVDFKGSNLLFHYLDKASDCDPEIVEFLLLSGNRVN